MVCVVISVTEQSLQNVHFVVENCMVGKAIVLSMWQVLFIHYAFCGSVTLFTAVNPFFEVFPTHVVVEW